jgi:hypothetical protein
MDDEVISDLTKEDLLKFGFLTGDAIKFLKAFASTAADPARGAAAKGGGSVASAASAAGAAAAAFGGDAMAVPSVSGGDAYALFVAAYDASLAPQYPDQLLAAVRESIFAFCRKLRVSEAQVVRYFKDIQAEAVEHKHELLDSIAESAVLIWTSAKRLTLAPGKAVEF